MSVITERFPAIVTRLADDSPPRGRVFVKCPEVTGDDTQELPDPIEPIHQWGWFTVPDVGEEIEIEAVVADDTAEDVKGQAFLEAPEWRWMGRRFPSSDGEQPRPPNAIFTGSNHGKRRGFATPTGHFLMFDDTTNSEAIVLSWTRPDGAVATLDFNANGSILITNRNGSAIFLDASQNANVVIVDEHGNMITLDSNGVRVVDVHGNSITTSSSGVDVQSLASGTINVDSQGGTVNVLGGTVNIGDGANSPIARFTELQQWADTHVHLTAFGPSSPPSAAGTPLPPAVASQAGNVAP